MEIEALKAILMDDFKEIHSGESGLSSSKPCYHITVSPQDDEADDSTSKPDSKSEDLTGDQLLTAVQVALIFSHTERYPDEPPLLNVRSIRGLSTQDLRILKEKLEEEASENLGMAMVFTLVTSAKEWLSGRFGQDDADGSTADDELAKDEVIVPHGEPVTVETFLAWRERFEAEIALERAKLMPDSALTAPKEKKLTGRQWFESGRAVAAARGTLTTKDESDEEEEEDIDFDDDDFEDDEEDMLEHYLAEKSDSTHS
ncbi:hypothetical protein Cgig2_000908 [Carnegiea gigantea]|uniref:RWD domain-containing protein n=1 Tax=Carnegiea gigantea TaxID=171969 RepID=A0A9Q1KKH1_9CARY|nr:hypothetical protein Cgig2_000908 [Carnegiea gigantea]